MTHDQTSAPQTHREPAEAHSPEAAAEHVRDMEGLAGHVDEHMLGGHSHGEARLGAIDWPGWGYAALGVLAGLIVVIAFWLAIS